MAQAKLFRQGGAAHMAPTYSLPVPSSHQSTAGGYGLGEEEMALNCSLLALKREAQELLASISRAGASLTKSQLAHKDRQLQDQLAAMRSHIRDMELLAEEQDTYVGWTRHRDDPTRGRC